MKKPPASRTGKKAGSLSVVEAQDAIAATLGEFEKLARRFFVIARDLGADLDDEEFPEKKPGPGHLRWFTALSAMGLYTELIELLNDAREAAERTDRDLMDEWQENQRHAGAAAKPMPPAEKKKRDVN